MKTIILVVGLSATSVLAQTNTIALGLKVAEIRPLPFFLTYTRDPDISVGKRIEDYRVTAVTPSEVTMVRAGSTVTVARGHGVPRDVFEVILVDTNGTRYIARSDRDFHHGLHVFKVVVDGEGEMRCGLEDTATKASVKWLDKVAQPMGPRDGVPAAHDP
ncbi:MAG: hypothetical protein WCS01_14115 [bacterium]